MTQKYAILFTEYRLPNGEQHEQFFETEREDVKQKADELITAGYKFEVEELRTGMISSTIVGLDSDGYEAYLAICLCMPSTECHAMVEKMILDFKPEGF